MSKNTRRENANARQIRIDPGDPRKLVQRIDAIASKNGLSAQDVANLALAAGLSMVDAGLDLINQAKVPELPKAA